MRTRTFLRLAATGAAGWAIGVSGVEDNPRFAVLLLVVAATCFVAAENYGRVRLLHHRWKWKFKAGVVVLMVAAVSVGAYLAVHYRTDGSGPVVDEQARTLAGQAKDQSAALAGKVSALEAQVKTAMDFQQREKEAREAREKTAEAEGLRRQSAREALGSFLDSGRKLDAEIRASRIEPIQKVNRWIAQLEATLRKVLDESYVARSRSVAGVTLSGRAWDTPPPPELLRALFDLDIRLARLQEFLKELGS